MSTKLEQPVLPAMKNNDQRKEWLKNYKDWGLWYTDEHIGANYYKYDFENGARLIVSEYPLEFTSKSYHLVGGPEAPRNSTHGYGKWERHEKYSPYGNSETELVEFLKFVQRRQSH